MHSQTFLFPSPISNLAIQFGDGSSTQVMVRYGNSAEDSKVSITQISVRIYVKLAENQIVSIIHADGTFSQKDMAKVIRLL